MLGNQRDWVYVIGSHGLHICSENEFPTFLGPSSTPRSKWWYKGQLHSLSPSCWLADCKRVNRKCRTGNIERKERGKQEQRSQAYLYSLWKGFLQKTVATRGRNSGVIILQQRKKGLKADRNLGWRCPCRINEVKPLFCKEMLEFSNLREQFQFEEQPSASHRCFNSDSVWTVWPEIYWCSPCFDQIIFLTKYRVIGWR